MTTLTPAQAAPTPAPGPLPRHRGVGALAASRIFVGRSMRHSLRDGEGMLLAVVLPVMLMLLFTVVFGGAIDAGGGYVTS